MKHIIFSLTILLFTSLAALQAQTIALTPSDAGLLVEIDGQLFTEYITKNTPRPYLYPLIGAAGVNVSRDFPMKPDVPGEERFRDHKHHRSLWFAHSKVNGINFWSEYQVFGRQEHTGFSEIKSAGNSGSFLAATKWVAPTGETVLTDKRRITITALPDGERTLDFDITLQATSGDILLGDTKEGTMAMRLCPSQSMNSSKNFVNTGNSTGHAFNSNGIRDHAIWGKRANWVCYHDPDPKGNPVAVTMFDHPGNLRSPTTWHARDYGLVAANPFGLHDFEPDKPAGAGDYTIKKGDSLSLRYRFYFAKGTPKPEALDAKFQDYASDLPPPKLHPSSSPPPAKPVTIVAFGDSTTAVRGSTTIYATLLQEELRNVRVINAGVGGSTTEMGRKRFETEVLAHQPQIAIIQFGINDAAVDVWKTPPASEARVSLGRYEENLRHFVQTLKSRETRVVLMTPNPLRWTPKLKEMYGKPPYQPENADGFNAPLVPYCEAARRVAREEGADLLDMQQAFVEQAQKMGVAFDTLLSDGMHPNDVGHRIEADLLREHILGLAKSHGLPITEGPLWKASGEFVTIHPACTDITHDSPNSTVYGCGLARMKDGAVITVYSTPTGAYSKPGTTWIAGRVTKDGGKTWSPESVIARHSDCQPSHPSVLTARDGVIHVFYLGFKTWKWKGVNPTDETQSDLWTTRSSDNGVTWSEPQLIFKGYTGASNGAIETREGQIIVPFSHYVNDPGRLVSRVAVSSDGGKTWSLGNPIDIGGAGDHEGALEPCVLELKDGRVWMLIRTTRKVFWESFSTDGGKTWSEAKATAINASSAPGHLTRLADGRIALVWNPGQRVKLHLALSADEGKTWTPSFNVAQGTPGGATYPFVIEVEPGELWIGYHNVPKGWNFPRARHLRVSVSSVSENALKPLSL